MILRFLFVLDDPDVPSILGEHILFAYTRADKVSPSR